MPAKESSTLCEGAFQFSNYLSLIGNFQACCSENCSHESIVQPIFDY